MLGSYYYQPQIFILSSTYSFFLSFDFFFSIFGYSDIGMGMTVSFIVDISAYDFTIGLGFSFYISFILVEHSLSYGYALCCMVSYSLI